MITHKLAELGSFCRQTTSSFEQKKSTELLWKLNFKFSISLTWKLFEVEAHEECQSEQSSSFTERSWWKQITSERCMSLRLQRTSTSQNYAKFRKSFQEFAQLKVLVDVCWWWSCLKRFVIRRGKECETWSGRRNVESYRSPNTFDESFFYPFPDENLRNESKQQTQKHDEM